MKSTKAATRLDISTSYDQEQQCRRLYFFWAEIARMSHDHAIRMSGDVALLVSQQSARSPNCKIMNNIAAMRDPKTSGKGTTLSQQRRSQTLFSVTSVPA